MQTSIAALAGAGVALGASLACWPLVIQVANSQLVGAFGMSGAAAEFAFALPVGLFAGVCASLAAGLASPRAWPTAAYGSWLVWSSVVAALLATNFVPLLFAATSVALAYLTIAVFARRWQPRDVPGPVRAVLLGCSGFVLFVAAILALAFGAVQVRPGEVTFEEFRRYKDAIDLLGVASLAGAILATLGLASAASPRRLRDALVSVATLGVLMLAATPMLGFLSACYVGEVLVIFGWLGSTTC